MGNIHNDRYDEIKSLIKRSKMLLEINDRVNLAKDLEQKLDSEVDDENENSDTKSSPDRKQKYRISGGIITLHGKDESDLEITSDEKAAFQETMDEFVEDVSDLVDFNELNVYENSVEWSGKVIDEDMEFILTIGEDSGIYINADMIKLDDELLQKINKLQQFYQKFKSIWSKVLAVRKKTNDEL